MIDTEKAASEENASGSVVSDVIVASFHTDRSAEAAMRRLIAGSVRPRTLSLIGRDRESQTDAESSYLPANAALTGAKGGAWLGGLVGLLGGAFGFFLLPIAGAFVVVGPLSAMIAGVIGGAGTGALLNGLIAAGLPGKHAQEFHTRLESAEFLVVVHPDADQTMLAHEILEGTGPSDLQTHRRRPETAV